MTSYQFFTALKSNSWLTWHRSACTEVSWFVFICILSMACLIILIPRKGCKVKEILMSALSCKGNNSKMIKRHLPVFFLQGRLSTGGTDQQLYAGIKQIILAQIKQYNEDNAFIPLICFRTCVCGVSDVLSIAGADEELDLGKQGLKIRDVWHGKLHKPAIQLKDTTIFFKWTLKTSWICCESTSHGLTKQLKHRGNVLGCPTLQEQCPDGRDSWPEAPHFYWSAHTVESSDLRNTALWMKTWFHISLTQIYTQSRSHI